MRSVRRIRSQASARSATVTEMQAALMALDKKLERIVIEALTPTPLPQVLSHYTQNSDTVVELLRSRELWDVGCGMWESEFGARGSGAAVQFNMLKETVFEDPRFRVVALRIEYDLERLGREIKKSMRWALRRSRHPKVTHP